MSSQQGIQGDTTPWAEKKWPAIILILLAVIGTGVVQTIISQHEIDQTQKQINQTQKQELINLAKGYLIDIENVNKTITAYRYEFNNPDNPDHNKPQEFINPLYPSWGLYHSTKQEISKFPPKLSNHMYYFYNQILIAENARMEFNNYKSLHPLDPNFPLEPQKQNDQKVKDKLFISYWNIIVDLQDYTIPALETDLNELIHSP